jgi:hypothetical protein
MAAGGSRLLSIPGAFLSSGWSLLEHGVSGCGRHGGGRHGGGGHGGGGHGGRHRRRRSGGRHGSYRGSHRRVRVRINAVATRELQVWASALSGAAHACAVPFVRVAQTLARSALCLYTRTANKKFGWWSRKLQPLKVCVGVLQLQKRKEKGYIV